MKIKFKFKLKQIMENNVLNVKALGSKFQSKHEMYRFLTTEVDMHLPPQKE